MNSTPIRVVGKALGTWMAIVAFVAFLTFAFNFLGTILCAVVIGMMMGAARHPKWQSVPVSLIFPALVLLMLGLVKTELARDQMYAVAGLCFGAYWLTYGLTFILRSVEGKQATCPKKEQPGASREEAVPLRTCGQQSPEVLRASTSSQVLELSLEMLQGWWEGKNSGEANQRGRTMEITKDQIAVKGLNAEGGICWEANGCLRVERLARSGGLVCSAATTDSSADACVMI
jgi:hypothetical protein